MKPSYAAWVIGIVCLGSGFVAPGCDTAGDGDDDGEHEGGGSRIVATDACSSGRKWVGGDEESPQMHPGRDCIGCHAERGEGPHYLVAGTVYETADEPDDCLGVADAVVEITDAEGTQWQLDTNAAGNFFLEARDGPIVMPYTTVVSFGGAQRVMATPQSTGACASCHTEKGANAAPGRILAP